MATAVKHRDTPESQARVAEQSAECGAETAQPLPGLDRVGAALRAAYRTSVVATARLIMSFRRRWHRRGNGSSEEAYLGIGTAFGAYLDAQKGLGKAFRQRERQDRAAYIGAVRRYHTYEEAIESAFRTRQEVEEEALQLYRSTVDKAWQTYRERARQSLKACQQTIEQVRRESKDTSADTAMLFEKEEDVSGKQERLRRQSPR